MIRTLAYYTAGHRDPNAPVFEHCELTDTEATTFLDLVQRARKSPEPDFVWIGLHDPSDEEFARIADRLDLGALRVEDSMSLRQRAKVEFDHDSIFAVLKVLSYNDATSEVETGQVSMFAGEGYLVTVRLGDLTELTPIRARLEAQGEKFLTAGPLGVLHAIADIIVDQYDDVAEEIGIDIQQIEESVFDPSTGVDETARAYLLKRENLEMRRAVDPLLPLASSVMRGEPTVIPAELLPHYRDLADHLLRVSELIVTYDSLLSSVLEAIRARVAIRQNDDMRKITAWVAIAAVPTAVAGIYGMNFDNMPELRWEYGYFVVLGLIATVCTVLYFRFKHSGWL